MTDATTATRDIPRLKTKYNTEVRDALKTTLGLSNVMQVPRFEKIVVNMGVGRVPCSASSGCAASACARWSTPARFPALPRPAGEGRTTMSMTDPIADMLTRIRNANVAMHDEVRMPSSKQKEALAAILLREGYIESFGTGDHPSGTGKLLTIKMKYTHERARTISGLRRVSKPGLRVYRTADSVPRVLGGLGVAVLSTSLGLMTDREARKRNVGGEVLCYVW